MTIANNLLADNVSSVETDASGWVAAGGTITWEARSIRYPDDPATGNHCLACLTSTAGTEMTVTTVSRVAVAEGEEYAAYMWASLPVQDGTVVPMGISVRWFDGAGALISESTRDENYVSNGYSQRLTMVTPAPASAATAEVQLRVTLPDTTTPAYLDGVYLGPVPNDANNLLTYEEYSLETGLATWEATGGTVERDWDTVYLGGTGFGDGSWYAKVLPGSDLVTAELGRLVPVTAGQFYSLNALILASDAGGVPTITARTDLEWFNASGESLGFSLTDRFSEADATGALAAMFVSHQARAPEGASLARPQVVISHPAGSTADYYLLDQVVLEESAPLYELTTNNGAGMVQVEVFYTPPWGTVGTFTLQRMESDGSAHPVRGYVGDLVEVPFTQSPLVVEDYEAPMGDRVWYRALWTDVDGDTGSLYTDLVDSPVLPDSDHVWLKSPGLPALNRKVVLAEAPSWSRQSRSTAYPVVGRRNPVNVSEVRGGRTGSLSLLVLDWDTNYGLDKLLDNGLPALIQAMPGNGLDGNLYLSLGDSEVTQVSGRPDLPGWRWGLGVVEIDRPSGGLQGSATATWQTVLDAYATWDDVFSTMEDWASVLTE